MQLSRVLLVPAATALLFLSSACSSRTQLLVVVDSDLEVPGELRELHAAVRDEGGRELWSNVFALEDGARAWPLSFGVLPRDGDPDLPVTVRVATPSIERSVTTTFIEGKILRVDLFLGRACTGIFCERGFSCAAGSCVAQRVPAESLPVIEPGDEPQPGSRMPDGGPLDAGAEMPRDAAEPPDAEPPPDAAPVEDAGVPVNLEFLDLNGSWNTSYDFDFSAAYWPSTVLTELDAIEQSCGAAIDTGFPQLDIYLSSVFPQFLAPWVLEIFDLLLDLEPTFSSVRANGGRMTITQDPPTSMDSVRLSAIETWTELVVLIPRLCPLRAADPAYPGCAEFHTPVTHNPAAVGISEILVEIRPAEGRLSAGRPSAELNLLAREVEMDLAKFILLTANVATAVYTPHNALQDALRNVVDCGGLGEEARDYAQNTLGLSTVAAIGVGSLVEDQCGDCTDRLAGSTSGLVNDPQAFEFDQRGRAIDETPFDSLFRPESLQTISTSSSITGNFLLSRDRVYGRWEGTP